MDIEYKNDKYKIFVKSCLIYGFSAFYASFIFFLPV